MKKICFILLMFSVLSSCTPVLKKELLSKGIIVSRLSEIKQNPVANKGKLFIFGGIIVKTKVTKDGSLIEAIYTPVTASGYLKDYTTEQGRFLALFRSREILDPLIFEKKREITLAAEFTGTRKGLIGEMEYTYPFFEIKEVYLWPDRSEYIDPYYMGPYYYYPPGYYRYRYYDPWYPWWYY
jgi:outer membrane lipoprotein